MQALKFIRNSLAACVALLAITSAPVKATAQVQSPSEVKTFLLAHGAWADGSSWAKVIPLLEAKGRSEFVPSQPLVNSLRFHSNSMKLGNGNT
jgi:hypothetical protein